jgi:predicted nucleic acid-binding protein
VIVIADTGGLLAAFDEAHPESERAFRSLEAAGLVVVSPLVLAELDHVARRELGHPVARQIIEDITEQVQLGAWTFPAVTGDVMRRANGVRVTYDGQRQSQKKPTRLDLADAVNVALAEEYETEVILATDQRDFRVLLPLTGHRAFRILPYDL